jgi:hypothetical protein
MLTGDALPVAQEIGQGEGVGLANNRRGADLKTASTQPGNEVDFKVFIDLSRDAIKNGPEYVNSMPVTREYEHRLWDHDKRSAYWLQGEGKPYSRTVSKD